MDLETEVRLRTDLVELVGLYVPLERQESTDAEGEVFYLGRCPLCEWDSEPNMIVRACSATWQCQDCKAEGSAVEWVMIDKDLPREAAVWFLAERLGLKGDFS